jgi:CDP-glycerol glycerophosphotransferase
VQFFHGVAGKYDLDAPRRMGAAGFATFDRVAFINEDRMRRYIQAGVVAESQAVLVGYPKADDLVNGRWSPALIRQSLGLDPSRPTAIYAPTFSVASSLHRAGLAIVRTLLDLGLNVIVKLHDRSMVPDAHYTGGIDWPRQFSVFDTRSGFALARGADVEPFLAGADILVTDHSTVGFEFALLDRPIVVYDAPDLLRAARIDLERWTSLRAMSHVAHTPSELAIAVGEALANPTSMAAERRRARDLFASPGAATQRALALVYELLDLAPPDALASNDGFPMLIRRPTDQAVAALRKRA